MTSYSKKFYDEMKDTNLVSARAVVPLIVRLVQPKSVIDVGCGTGIWLKAFQENRVADIFGVDGDWVKTDQLVIPASAFACKDLAQPFNLNRQADLAVCLEVGEHLPHKTSGELVKNLVAVAPVVMFSAAIPLQGGSRHINEQWPAYWAELFAKHDYVPSDCVRFKIWHDDTISFFYRQNIIIYVDKNKLASYPLLQKEIANGHDQALPLIQPFMYMYYAERWRLVVPILGKIPPSWLHFFKRMLKKFRR